MSDTSARPGAGNHSGRDGRRPLTKFWISAGSVIAAAGVAAAVYALESNEAAGHAAGQDPLGGPRRLESLLLSFSSANRQV